jgi:hypothetical protein
LGALYVSLDAVLIEEPTSPAVKRCVYGITHHPVPVIKTHWVDPDMNNLSLRSRALAEWFEAKTTKIYVVRNPIHVFPSLFAFESQIGAIGSDIRDWLEKKTRYWACHVETWTSRNDVMVIRFEDILADADATLKRIATALPELETVPRESVLPSPTRSLLHNRLQRLSRSPSSTEILSVRKKPEFENILSEAERAMFWRNVEPICREFDYPVAN